MGKRVFDNCKALRSVKMPAKLATMGEYCFNECIALTNISIPSNVRRIEQYTFYKCSALKTVTLPDSLTYLGYYCFYNCSLLSEVKFPDALAEIGYYAFYEYLNGFRKAIYWGKAKMEAHAKQYSQGYRGDLSKGTKYTFWSKDFDGMAKKTMLRQLISKYGVMSTELQNAYESDMAVINDDGTKDYVDNKETDAFIVEPVTGEVKSLDDIE
jgi:hypothetical protein